MKPIIVYGCQGRIEVVMSGVKNRMAIWQDNNVIFVSIEDLEKILEEAKHE